MKIAIIGAGISGLVSAYLLHGEHEVTVFEANDYIGGHTHTVDVTAGERRSAVDTGFVVNLHTLIRGQIPSSSKIWLCFSRKKESQRKHWLS